MRVSFSLDRCPSSDGADADLIFVCTRCTDVMLWCSTVHLVHTSWRLNRFHAIIQYKRTLPWILNHSPSFAAALPWTIPSALPLTDPVCAGGRDNLQATNNTDYLLLASANVSIFFDNSFVAKTNLRSVSPGESFQTFLGVDPAVKV